MSILQKRDYLEKAHQYATSKGGVCLADKYVNSTTKMEFKCGNEKHSSWFRNIDIVSKKSWCIQCSNEKNGNKKRLFDGLLQAQDIAKSRNGICLSKEYKNSTEKLLWKCENESHHIWGSPLTDIKKGRWCPKCAFERIGQKNTLVDGLNLAKDLAEKNNGKCLALSYEGSNVKMQWKCSESQHPIFYMDYSKVKKGCWCPKCSRLPKEIAFKRAKEKAKKHNGQLLSNEYIKGEIKLKWKCHLGHIWDSTYDTIVNKDSWCPVCFGFLSPEENYKKATKSALLKGGKCLSNIYENRTNKMLWQCASGHIWKAPFSSVVTSKRWCPTCAKYLYYKETKIRNLLNYLFDTNFFKDKPKWNINPKTNRRLELDGYSEELKMAFEFQGPQHFKKVEYFKMQEETLAYIQFKDQVKKQNCIKNGVKLLIINDNKECDTNEKIVNYLLKRLKEESVVIMKIINMNEINHILNNMTHVQIKNLEKAKKYAETRKGKCLTEVYSNSKEKLEWKCQEEHHPSWHRTMSVVYENSWCKLCYLKK